jgi:hypothetical protein
MWPGNTIVGRVGQDLVLSGLQGPGRSLLGIDILSFFGIILFKLRRFFARRKTC